MYFLKYCEIEWYQAFFPNMFYNFCQVQGMDVGKQLDQYDNKKIGNNAETVIAVKYFAYI